MSGPFFIIAIGGVLGPIWALRFGWLTIRQKDVLERILCGALAMLGLVAAAPAWILAAVMVTGGGERYAGFGIDVPVASPFGWAYLAIIGILAVIVGARRLRAKLSRP